VTVPERLEFWPDYSGVLLHAAGSSVALGDLPIPDDVIERADAWVAQYDDSKLLPGGSRDEGWITEGRALFWTIRSSLAAHGIVLDDWEGIWDQPTVRIEIAEEHVAKRAFAWGVDWPGWCRSGKTVDLAVEALIRAAPRYAVVAALAAFAFPATVATDDFDTADSVEGGATTAFGAPERITSFDLRPTNVAEADRLARLVEAAWTVFGDVVAGAPAELRKGPRGGGRDRDKIVAHVVMAEHAYARNMGVRLPAPDPADPAAVSAQHSAIAAVLREPSDGSTVAGVKWTSRYAARRVAWHVLDHAWEIEDRTDLA